MKYEEMCEICEQEDRDFWNSLDVTERCGIGGHISHENDEINDDIDDGSNPEYYEF